MNKTTIIMSKEEAMALPLNKRPLCYRISNEMYLSVWDAVGQATGCGNNTVHDAEKASDIAVKLMFKIAEEIEKSNSTFPVKCPDCAADLEIQGNKLNFIKHNI